MHRSPCKDCIVLVMCVNKEASDIMNDCELISRYINKMFEKEHAKESCYYHSEDLHQIFRLWYDDEGGYFIHGSPEWEGKQIWR